MAPRWLRTVVLVGLVVSRASVAAEAFTVPDTMAQRTVACTVCHGKEGRATNAGYFPRIAGKPAGYLYSQLLNFRDGRRHNNLMSPLLANLSDAYLREMAEYFAGLDLPYPPAQAAALPAQARASAEKLVRQGDAARGIPACTACHGAAMTGTEPGTPGLLGLPRDYLNAQLGAWRTGQRKATAPDCMHDIARKLDLAEVSAMADWLATQPVPVPAKAAAAPPSPMPIACGKLPSPSASPAVALPGSGNPTVERGRYLALVGNCAGCHTATGGAPYAGGRALPTPFGTVYTSNLTPDAATGLGQWTAAHFWQAMHHGRSRDGRLLNPAFPYPSYTHVTREDADAIHAYLRTVAPVVQANRAHDLRFPYNTQFALAVWRTLYFSAADPDAEPKKDGSRTTQWQRGAYLARGLGHCMECHSPRNALGAISGSAQFTGGAIPSQGWYAPSLAVPNQASVAQWPRHDVVALLKTGQAPGASVTGPMADLVYASTQHWSDADLAAVAEFLQSLPGAGGDPLPSKATAPVSTTALTLGGKLYERDCASCHGPVGQGVPGRYPALAGNRAVTMDVTTNLVNIVRSGGFAPATAGNPRPDGMPPFAHSLSDAEIASVLTYIRQAWGNRAAPVTELQVLQQVRAK